MLIQFITSGQSDLRMTKLVTTDVHSSKTAGDQESVRQNVGHRLKAPVWSLVTGNWHVKY